MKILSNTLIISLTIFSNILLNTNIAQGEEVDKYQEIKVSENRELNLVVIPEGETNLDFLQGNEYDIAIDFPKARLETLPTPEEIAKYEKLVQADRLYLAGDLDTAANMYREIKVPFDTETGIDGEKIPEPIYDVSSLEPAAKVYWEMYQEGIADGLESKILVPLQLLVENHPEYIPGHIHYAKALENYDYLETKIEVIHSAYALYPQEAEIVAAKIAADSEAENWLEASLTARRFVLFNSEHPQTEEFRKLAEENFQAYRRQLKSQLAAGAVGNIITGALGYALIGNMGAPISALETTMVLIQGESAVGDRLASQLRQQLPLVEDPEIQAYIDRIGTNLAAVAGRDDLDYEFYIIEDDNLNAFALPGGKIFINTGAILKTDSEAELAGLIAHEISHAALSHGFQLVTQGNLTANVVQFIPYGGTAGNLLVFNYSRDMERQADIYGTRILAASGYAADGLYELMQTLETENDQPNPPAWLSTHPNTSRRVEYLKTSIINNGFNRYAYHGVAQHREIQERIREITTADSPEKREDKYIITIED